jgi:hypothetical protein
MLSQVLNRVLPQRAARREAVAASIVLSMTGESYTVICDPSRFGEAARMLGRWADDPTLTLTWSAAALLITALRQEREALEHERR